MKAFHLHVTPEELDVLIEGLTSRCNRLRSAFKPATVKSFYDSEDLLRKLNRIKQHRIFLSVWQKRYWQTRDTTGKILDPDQQGAPNHQITL